MLSTFLLALLALAQQGDTGISEEELAAVKNSSSVTVKAKQVSKLMPTYPKLEGRRRLDAWVEITYCIDQSGKAQNVSVLDSVGTENFDHSAIKAVQSWDFEPALRDGNPVWQSRNKVLIGFSYEGQLRADGRFARAFRKIGRYIDQDNLKDADLLFQEVFQTYDMSLYELSKLWEQRVRYENKIGDLYKIDMAIHRAAMSKGAWIEKKGYVQLLALRAKVQTNLGKYFEARRSFNDLVDETRKNDKRVAELRPAFERIDTIIAGDGVITIKAEVRTRDECAYCDDSWAFTPVRNDFALSKIKGSLESIDMRCDNRRFESDISELVEWHIPDDWGTCHVQIYGEPGTTFEVLMLPSSSN